MAYSGPPGGHRPAEPMNVPSRTGAAPAPSPGASSRPQRDATLAERRVEALAEIGQTMVSGSDYEHVLAALIEKVARILDATSGGFMLYDELTGQLVLQKPAFGFDSEELISAYRVPLSGGGNAVTVFVSGQPYLTNNAPGDPRVLQRFVRLYGAERILTVPLQVEGRTIGVFHLINKRAGDFTRQDLELLQMMAPQLAVIIHSAAMMRQLRDHEQQLERIIDIHNALTGMVLGGGGLKALVDRLSQLLDLPVLMAESSGHMMASPTSSSAAEAVVAASLATLLTRMEEAASLDLRPVSMLLEGSGALTMMTVPIAVGSELMGSIAAVGQPSQLDDLTGRTLQQAALVFALEMVKEREVYEVERRLNADLVEHLLLAASDAEGTQLMRRLGLDDSRSHRAAYLEVTADRAQLAMSRRFQDYRAWLHRSVMRDLAGRQQGAAVVARDQGFVLVLPAAEGADPEPESRRLSAWLRGLLDCRPAQMRITHVLGVGGVAGRPMELRRSFEEARTVVAVQRQLSLQRPVLFFEQLGIYRLLAQPARREDLKAFVARALGPLLEHDRRSRSDWISFLEALAASNFSVKTAARHLGLHVNTAKYRAARIRSLLGVDLADPEARFELQLALKILSLDRAHT